MWLGVFFCEFAHGLDCSPAMHLVVAILLLADAFANDFGVDVEFLSQRLNFGVRGFGYLGALASAVKVALHLRHFV